MTLHPPTSRSEVAIGKSTLAGCLVCCQILCVDRQMESEKQGADHGAEVRSHTDICVGVVRCCAPLLCSIMFPKLISALVMCLEGVGLLQSVSDRRAASMDG